MGRGVVTVTSHSSFLTCCCHMGYHEDDLVADDCHWCEVILTHWGVLAQVRVRADDPYDDRHCGGFCCYPCARRTCDQEGNQGSDQSRGIG